MVGPLSSPEGFDVEAGLALSDDGSFYGTTILGGIYDGGTVFRVTTNGALTTLVSLPGGDGNFFSGGLTLGPGGSFYGVAGGLDFTVSADGGNIFKVTTNGVLTELTTFGGTNGANPAGNLTLGGDGTLYGVTVGYGPDGWTDGTVFQFTPDGTLTTLVVFDGSIISNAFWPNGGLTLAADGSLYGTTPYGGAYGQGTIFHLTTEGTLTELVTFNGTNGACPFAELSWGAMVICMGPRPPEAAAAMGRSSGQTPTAS